jgi:hypothetical protein
MFMRLPRKLMRGQRARAVCGRGDLMRVGGKVVVLSGSVVRTLWHINSPLPLT